MENIPRQWSAEHPITASILDNVWHWYYNNYIIAQ